MGLDPVPCGTDRPSSLGYLVLAVLSKVLCICVMVPVGAAIGELLSGLLASIPAVYVFCIIEPLQDPVVSAFLLEDNWTAPVFWMEPSHHISIIHMAFCDIQCPSPQLRVCTIRDSYIRIRKHFLYSLVHHPADRRHEGCSLEAFHGRLPVVELSAGLMVPRGMTLFTDCNQVPHPVGTTLAPVYDVMDMKDHVVICCFPAALAGISVTGKDCFPQGCNPVTFSLLVIGSFRKWFPSSMAFNI